jgi:hypothetical protein
LDLSSFSPRGHAGQRQAGPEKMMEAFGVVLIEIAPDLRARINGTPVETAPTTQELHAIVGTPARVVDPCAAPVGHRNNQIHVYDELGVYFIEHHYTRRIQGGTVVFWIDEQGYRFTPSTNFNGKLILASYSVPAMPPLLAFLKACPIPFSPFVGGSLFAKNGEYAIHIESQGMKLRSGRRSKVRTLVDLSFSWSHDNWAHPVADQ